MGSTLTHAHALELLRMEAFDGHEVNPEVLHAAYLERAKELHPDRPGGSTEAFQELHAAYMLLTAGETPDGRPARVEVSTWAGVLRAAMRAWSALTLVRRLLVVGVVFAPLWAVWGVVWADPVSDAAQVTMGLYLGAVMSWWVVKELRRPRVQPSYWIFVPAKPTRGEYMDRLKEPPPE